MGNIVYINANGHLGKAAFEAVTYAKKLGGTVKVLATGSLESSSLGQLGKYGANEVLVNRGIIGSDDKKSVPGFHKNVRELKTSFLVMTFMLKPLRPDCLFD